MAGESGGPPRVTLGADQGYDQKEWVRELRVYQVTPHGARQVHNASDHRTTRHGGYAISQIKRKRGEEICGWLKTLGGLRKTRHRGADRLGGLFTFAAAAYHLVRMPNLWPIAT
jgi:IS5 family transposase